MAINTYTSAGNQLSAEMAEVYQKAMLERFVPETVFYKYAKMIDMSKRSGATVSVRRMELPTFDTIALTEGVPPTEVNLNITKVTATVAPYGNFAKVSDMLNLTGLDDLILETSEAFGQAAGLQTDRIIRDAMLGTTNVMFANGRASRAALVPGDKISAADIVKARTALVKASARKIMIPGMGPGYIAFVHPDTANQIMQLQEWKEQNTYVDTKNREDGLIGKMYGIYFIETVNAATFTNGGAGGNLAGKSIIIIGQDGYGVADIAGTSKPEIIVQTEGGTSNPLNQFSTIGYKTFIAALRLNDAAVLKLDCLDA